MFVESTSLHCRVVMIGDSAVGKTSILNQLIDHTFQNGTAPTVAANYQVYLDEIDGVTIEVQLWDTAGQEKFRSLGPIYYRNSAGAVLVYDVSNRRSFEDLSDWIVAFTEVAGTTASITIVANKTDIPEAEQRVRAQEGRQWATSKGYDFFATSAKTGEGIKELFKQIARNLIRIRLSGTRSPTDITVQAKKCTC
jgi:small GTP-binding protein